MMHTFSFIVIELKKKPSRHIYRSISIDYVMTYDLHEIMQAVLNYDINTLSGNL